MKNQCLEGAPPMNDTDRQLQQLVKQVQQHPPLSRQRQIALNKLVNEIRRSHTLCHPQKSSWQPHIYEELYSEALQKTLLEFCQNIDNYKDEYAVMACVNQRLKQRFIDVVRQYYQQVKITIVPLDEISSFTSAQKPDNSDDYLELLRQFLTEDPENRLKTISVKGRPDVTFQILALAKFVEDQTWEEISQCFGISVQTLASFVNRNLHKLIPYFRKYLQE